MSRPSAREDDLAGAAEVFAALGDETRLALVARLCRGGSQSITQLTAGAAVTRQAITKHLDVLDGAGLVHHARRGREHIWDLETERLSEAGEYLDQISAQWDDAISRLKNFVEVDHEEQR